MRRLSPFEYSWIAAVLFWTLLVGASFVWNWRVLDQHVVQLGTAQGRDIFRMIEAMRLWNARHGGLYAVQSERARPNPHLDVPDRDPVTTSGKRLTLINPAYMTRQVGETIAEQTGIVIHITSLKPVNPDNAPDDWERDALTAFTTGVSERVRTGDGEVRYMAPLPMELPCMACHAGMGYRVGDIRGGISVRFPSQAIEDSLSMQRRQVIALHLLAWALLTALGVGFMARVRAHAASLSRLAAEQERLVEQRTAELRHLVNAAGNGLFGIDAAGHCVFCNARAQALLALPGLEARDGPGVPERLERDNPPFAERLRRALAGESAGTEIVTYHPPGGASYPLELCVDPVRADGAVIGAVATFADVSERERRQQAVWRQANFDELTGLPNRSLFIDRCERALAAAARRGEGAAILFIDLDGFKPVNDRHGHAVGDRVLIEVARRIPASLRESDTAARLGGDEFVVVLPGAGAAEAQAIAGKLAAALARPYGLDVGTVRLAASIGVALYPQHGSDVDALLHAADLAMYGAKEAGQGAVCLAVDGSGQRSADS